jgi:hypothetical protein
MKHIKKESYHSAIQYHQLLTDILKKIHYIIPHRFVLHISFFILPFLSYGQGFYSEANALPAVGLENVYINPQQKIAPALFVTSNTIISKSETTAL